MSVAVQRTKRRQQREETRRQILVAAQDFLSEHDFRELSVDALMTRTGHTRTVFYRHFEDIPTMMLALIDAVGAELVDFGEAWGSTEAAPPSPEEARRRLGLFVGFYVRNGRMVRAVAEAAHHDELVNQAYAGMIEAFIAITAHAMQHRIQTGEIAPLDAEEIARAMVWMLNGYLLDKLGGPHPADADRVLDTVWTIWTRTLFPGRAN
jgi:AcrR family transcriptional regulator